jgi:transcriptional regulator with XRE-family HTH domain
MSYFVKSVTFTRSIKKLLEENHQTIPSTVKYCFALKKDEDDSRILGVLLVSPLSAYQPEYLRTAYLEISLLWVEPQNLEGIFLQKVLKYLQKHTSIIGLLVHLDSTSEKMNVFRNNFIFKGFAKQSYHYEKDGEFFHKKRVWREATKLEVSEAEHANTLGLTKVIDARKAIFEFVFHREHKTNGVIYKIEFENGKVYIGQTSNGIDYRYKGHLSSARNGSTMAVHEAMRNCNYRCSISEIERVPIADLTERENYWIRKYQSTNKEIGYNDPYAPDYIALRIPEDVLFEAFNLRKQGLKYAEISKKIGLNRDLINSVIWGRVRPEIRQKWLEENQDLEKQKTLNDEEVLTIFELYDSGLPATEIAQKLDVTKQYVWYVLNGQMRPEIKARYEASTGKSFVYTNDKKVDLDVASQVLKKRYEDGVTNIEIAQELGLTPTQVTTIVTGKTAKEVSTEYIKDKKLDKNFIRDEVLLQAFDLVFKELQSQEDVAKKLGVSKSYLSMLFNGRTRSDVKERWEMVNGKAPSLKSLAQKRRMQDSSVRDNLSHKFKGKKRDHPTRCRPCFCSNGLHFKTVKEAAEHYDIHPNTVTWSLTHKEPVLAKEQDVVFQYELEEHKQKPSKERAVRTSENLYFKTIKDAAVHYGLDWSTVKSAIEHPRTVGGVDFYYA